MCGIIGLLKIASLKEFLIYNLFSYTQPMGAWVWQLVLETVGKHTFVEVSSLGRRKQEGVVSTVLKRYYVNKANRIFFRDILLLIVLPI